MLRKKKEPKFILRIKWYGPYTWGWVLLKRVGRGEDVETLACSPTAMFADTKEHALKETKAFARCIDLKGYRIDVVD